MKELTIEQKAKAYDKALERAKEFYILCKKCGAKDTVDFLEDNFPELCEPDDEKIRKTLLRWIQSNSYTNIAGMPIKNIIDWLEKQGEQKPIINVPTREVIISIWDLGNEWKELTNGSISTEYGTQLDYIQKHWHESEYYLREKQGEQKVPVIDFKAKDWYVSKVDGKIRNIYHSVDKVEPKFKVGDWIIDDKNRIGIIVRILDEHYIISFDGREVQIPFEWEGKLFRKWSIKDAKDGDVLCVKYGNDEMPFIFTGKQDNVAYCALNSFGEFVLSIAEWLLKISVLPATKEQRDTLMKAMTDAGYTFDFEKKELKKINKNTDVGHEYFSDLLEKDDCDNIDDYAYQCAYCMSYDWMKDTATWDDVERACKLGAEWNERHCKSIWSDEDVYNSKLILSTINQDQDLSLKTKDKLTSWIKSIKQRIRI